MIIEQRRHMRRIERQFQCTCVMWHHLHCMESFGFRLYMKRVESNTDKPFHICDDADISYVT